MDLSDLLPRQIRFVLALAEDPLRTDKEVARAMNMRAGLVSDWRRRRPRFKQVCEAIRAHPELAAIVVLRYSQPAAAAALVRQSGESGRYAAEAAKQVLREARERGGRAPAADALAKLVREATRDST